MLLIIGEESDLKSISGLETARIIITFELSMELELKKRNLPVLYFHRYAQSKRIWSAIVASATRWLETWPTRPVLKGLNAADVFKFEDTSLWWFVYDAIWETKNGIFDAIYQTIALKLLLQEYNPSTIELHGKFDFNIEEVMRSLSTNFGCHLKAENALFVPTSRNELTRPKGKLKLLVRFTLLKIAKILSSNAKKKHVVTFFMNHGSTAVEKYWKGSYFINDHYLEGFEDYMVDKRSDKLFVSLNMPKVSAYFLVNLFKDTIRTLRGVYVPWLSYSTLSDLDQRRKLVGYYHKMIMEMETEKCFREAMFIDGIDIYPLLRDTFRGSLPRSIALVHSEILLARRFVNSVQPAIVFHTEGMSSIGRALAFECRKRNIRVMAPQLGVISTELPVNTSFLINAASDNRILPEYMVWGPFYKALITDRGFPGSLVKIVGFWRSGTKIDTEGSQSGDYALYIAGANLGKLNYILSLDEEISTIRLVFKALPRGLRLVVKLHPTLPYEVYARALHDIINEITLVGGPNTPGIETFLPKARFVVGKASTVLIQAIILGKPIIVTNFASELNFFGIQGVPFVTTFEEFVKEVRDVLDNKLQFNFEYHCSPVGRDSVSLIIDEIEK